MADTEVTKKQRNSSAPQMINLTVRFPLDLYRRLPVKPAKSSGRRGGGIAGYLVPLLVEAIENELAAREQAV